MVGAGGRPGVHEALDEGSDLFVQAECSPRCGENSAAFLFFFRILRQARFAVAKLFSRKPAQQRACDQQQGRNRARQLDRAWHPRKGRAHLHTLCNDRFAITLVALDEFAFLILNGFHFGCSHSRSFLNSLIVSAKGVFWFFSRTFNRIYAQSAPATYSTKNPPAATSRHLS